MKNIFSKYLKLLSTNDLVKVSSRNSIQLIIRLLVGLVNIKLFALWLGTSGMALFGQFANFTQLIGNISSGGINHGITKLVAQYHYSESRKKLILSNGVLIALVFTMLTTVSVILFPHFLARKILFDVYYAPVIRSFGILILSNVISNFVLSLFNGEKAYSKFIRLNIFITLSNFAISVPALYWYQLEGLIWAQFVSGVISIFYCIHMLVSSKVLSGQLKVFFPIIRRLLLFGLMLLVASITTPLVKIITRYIIVEECSLSDAGLWDGINRISNTYTNLIISSLGLYFMPKVSQLIDFRKINLELKNALVMIVPLVMFASGIMYLTRDLIITLLFSTEFDAMRELFVYQCVGDVLKIVAWFFGITLMIKEHAKVFIYLDITVSVLMVINAWWMIPLFGVVGSAQIYLINNFIYLILVVAAYKRYVARA